MKTTNALTIRHPLEIPFSMTNTLFFATITIVMMLSATVKAEPEAAPADQRISIKSVVPEATGGYGYVLEYDVPAPIEVVWRFKTDFNSEMLLTNAELIGHRVVRRVGSSVITENQYAIAPGFKFLWRTTMLPDKFRLTFELLNPEACRHDFHHGSIQLSPAGGFTKITQVAYFNFRGASLWIKYPWYGGMKSTLTKVARWEQQLASRYKHVYLAELDD